MTRSIREQVLQHDKLLFYPYEAMNPFLDLVHEAAYDPECISLRITLYRVAKQSRLCESLIDAAENGKEVTVLMELRARFDEQNNIEWAERLEEAGCTVIYGSEGFKCHSKICQLTYREGMALTRLTLLGTGNFNEKTAKLYSDFMLMTAHPGIGEDANLFFRNLSLGNLRGDYRFLGVAPVGLKPLIMRGLDREIQRALAGEPARVFFKLNSLTDREVIDKIAEASCAGVRVDMIIRGISCLKPGVPGKTENVHVRSIVGRFLEHARVYAFGVDSDMIYLSSADMMTRNTEHRVEIAFPVLDPTCRALVHEYMGMQLRDNVKARSLTSDGTWVPVERKEGEKPFNSQEALLERAYRNAEAAAQQRAQEKERVTEEAIHSELEHEAAVEPATEPEAAVAPPVAEPEPAEEPEAVEAAPEPVVETEPAAAPAAALDMLGTLTQDPGQGAAGAAVRAVLDESPNLAPGYEAVRRAADTAGAEQRVEDTAALEALLGPGLHISPTRFEKYQYCPFGYFLQYILKAAPRQKAELAPNISGTLTHWVLENALRRQGEAFKDLTPEELETLVNDLVDEYTAANLPGMTLRMEYLVGRIRRNLVGLLGFIQRDLRQSGFQPVAFELRIDDRPDADDPDAPRVDPVELDDGAGHIVRIVGTVDRVDAMPLEKLGRTYLRVVDYKTGGKEFKLKEVYCGLDCQMLLYLFTLERNAKRQFPGATAAGVEYLLADPAPKSVDRSELGDDADPAPTYPMNGLLLDEESIYRAMDTKGTGEFVPLSFSAKTGKPLNAKSTLADTAKLGRIRDHLDGLLIDMAKNLYSGRIDAEPLCTGGRSPCTYCEFRCACTHRDGEHERTINIKDDPFAE